MDLNKTYQLYNEAKYGDDNEHEHNHQDGSFATIQMHLGLIYDSKKQDTKTIETLNKKLSVILSLCLVFPRYTSCYLFIFPSHRLLECLEMISSWAPDKVKEQVSTDNMDVTQKLQEYYNIYQQEKKQREKHSNQDKDKANDDVRMTN